MARIAISGASGFIGLSLISNFRSKHHELVSISFRDGEGALSRVDLEGFDAVIHLAGEPVSLGRWSASKQKAILDSRILGTSSLCRSIMALRRPPSVFLSASAVGYYGNCGEEILTEEAPNGIGFLAHVCAEWERESRPLVSRGIRVVHARFGVVLGKGGGVMKKLLPLYRFGLGGRLGSGKQWVSWVSLTDLILALEHILRHPEIEGAVNVVSPHPVRQEIFASTLAHVLHRPAAISMPAWFLNFVFGLAADEVLLTSQRAVPQALIASGFVFRYPSLEMTLTKCV